MSFNPRCKRCGTENPLDFSRGGRSNHGVQPLCKACTKPKQALYRNFYKQEKIRAEKEALIASGQMFFFGVGTW